MTSQQAAAKAKKRWGNRFYIRAGEHFSSPERRDKALQTVREARAEMKRLDEEVARRLKECDWYQELQKQRRECRKQIEGTEGHVYYYRFNVGKSNGMFTEIVGQGDTWEEAFARADAKANAA